MMIFKNTAKERGMWRGWLKNGQCLELHYSRTGWEFGAGVLIHSNDENRGSRMICLQFWRFSAYIPIGISDGPFEVGDEPQWSLFASQEFQLVTHWGTWRKTWYWPWSLGWYRSSYLLSDWSWFTETAADVKRWRKANPPGCGIYRPSVRDQIAGRVWAEDHPYSYTLRSGEVQNVTATITIAEMEWRRRWLPFTKLFRQVQKSIEVNFSGEVGERAGSWKGGTIGCNYEMRTGETPLDTLRRMERERRFT